MTLMLLGICLAYGWILAKLFGGENFQNVWIWSTFILFIVNDRYYKVNVKRCNNKKDEEE